jgi:hypothetical protein
VSLAFLVIPGKTRSWENRSGGSSACPADVSRRAAFWQERGLWQKPGKAFVRSGSRPRPGEEGDSSPTAAQELRRGLPFFVTAFGLILVGLVLATRGWARWSLYGRERLPFDPPPPDEGNPG